MKRAAAVLSLLLPLLAACDSRRPTQEEYLATVPRIIAFLEEDARKNAPGQPAEGPLFLDARSFTANGSRMVQAPIDTAAFRAAVRKPFETVVAEDSVLLLDETETAGGTWVKQYGVYLHLNQVRSAGDRMTALGRSTITDRSAFPTRICDRIWQMIFRREGGAWALAETNLRRDTCTGEER